MYETIILLNLQNSFEIFLKMEKSYDINLFRKLFDLCLLCNPLTALRPC